MATNYVKARYQEIYDFGTQAGKTTILGVHSPTGNKVQEMLGGFFRQFRKYRYSGCTVTMVPAAQLPADPLQVSFEAGALTIDPRDMLNPILFHGAHGESLNEALNLIYNTSTDEMIDGPSVKEIRDQFSISSWGSENAYYSALCDPSFKKFGIQSGAKVNLRPMVHPVVLNHAMLPSASGVEFDNTSVHTEWDSDAVGSLSGMQSAIEGGGIGNIAEVSGAEATSHVPRRMFTSGLRPLGWLNTTQFASPLNVPAGATNKNWFLSYTYIPKIMMGVFILPPSYTQEMYFRLIINHYFEFKDFSTALSYSPDGARLVYTETIPEPSDGASGVSSVSLDVENGTIAKTTDGVF